MGFQGVYYNAIDAKGRVSIPARFRERLNGDDALVVTQDRGGVIAYPVEEITIAGNLKDMLRGIVAIGSDVETRGSRRVGSILIERMTLAGD